MTGKYYLMRERIGNGMGNGDEGWTGEGRGGTEGNGEKGMERKGMEGGPERREWEGNGVNSKGWMVSELRRSASNSSIIKNERNGNLLLAQLFVVQSCWLRQLRQLALPPVEL